MKPQVTVGTPSSRSRAGVARSAFRAEREDCRAPYRIPCRVRLVNAETGEVRSVAGETVNLSRRGMALQLGVDVPVGTWVETLVLHPNGDPMFLCGTVLHSRRTMAANFEIGVKTDRPMTFV
jgi:hypothetical protein